MRFTCLIAIITLTVTLVATPQDALAKHRYFANTLPGTNYLNRCLGVGWSDGYHASAGWPTHRPAQHLPMPSGPGYYGNRYPISAWPYSPVIETTLSVPTSAISPPNVGQRPLPQQQPMR